MYFFKIEIYTKPFLLIKEEKKLNNFLLHGVGVENTSAYKNNIRGTQLVTLSL